MNNKRPCTQLSQSRSLLKKPVDNLTRSFGITNRLLLNNSHIPYVDKIEIYEILIDKSNTKLFESVVHHIVAINYTVEVFLTNYKKIIHNFNNDIDIQTQFEHIDDNIIINKFPIYMFNKHEYIKIFNIPLGACMKNVHKIYGIIGMVSSLFGNCRVDHEEPYLYTINKYFQKTLRFRLAIIIDELNYKNDSNRITSQLTNINGDGKLHHQFIIIQFYTPSTFDNKIRGYDLLINYTSIIVTVSCIYPPVTTEEIVYKICTSSRSVF
jgi:hypothetical protein